MKRRVFLAAGALLLTRAETSSPDSPLALTAVGLMWLAALTQFIRARPRMSAVAGRPWPEGSEFRVVSVEEPWASKLSRGRREKEAQEAVSSAEQLLVSAGLKATGAVLSGNAKQVIIEEAQKWAAD